MSQLTRLRCLSPLETNREIFSVKYLRKFLLGSGWPLASSSMISSSWLMGEYPGEASMFDDMLELREKLMSVLIFEYRLDVVLTLLVRLFPIFPLLSLFLFVLDLDDVAVDTLLDAPVVDVDEADVETVVESPSGLQLTLDRMIIARNSSKSNFPSLSRSQR